MSADNGYILRKNKQGQFVLQMYSASADELPDVESACAGERFDTLEEALAAYEEFDRGMFASEYGLSVKLKEPSLDDYLPTSSNNAGIWATKFLQRYDYVLVPEDELRQWFAAALLTGSKVGYAKSVFDQIRKEES